MKPHRGSRLGAVLRSPYLFMTLAMLCWSGNWLVGRAMHAEVTAIGLTFWRWTGALAVLLTFTGRPLWRARRVILREWRIITALSFLGVALFNTLIYQALNTTTAINAALFNSTIPIIIVLISWLVFREGVTRRQLIGIALSLLGVVALVSKGEAARLLSLSFTPGDLWAIAALPAWSLYTVLLKRGAASLEPMVLLTAMAALGAVMLAPFYGWELARGSRMAFTLATVLTVVYVALFASVIAFALWNSAVSQVGANRAGVFVHLHPVFTTVLAIAFLGEVLRAYHWVGIVLIFAGICLTTLAGPGAPVEQDEPALAEGES